jgi:hypothetical protein
MSLPSLNNIPNWQEIDLKAWAEQSPVTIADVDEVLRTRRSVVEARCAYDYQRTLAAQLRAQSNRHKFQAEEAIQRNEDDGVKDPGIASLCKARQYTDAIQAENAEMRAEQALLEYQLYVGAYLHHVGGEEV